MRALSSAAIQPALDGEFAGQRSLEEVASLLAPFESAGLALRSIGHRVKLLSSLQPLEAGPELEQAFLSGALKEPVFSYSDRSSDIAYIKQTLLPLQDFSSPEGHPLATPIIQSWLQEKVHERFTEVELIEARGNMTPGEGSKALEVSRRLYGTPDPALVTICEQELGKLLPAVTEVSDASRGFTPQEVRELILARYLIPWFNGQDLPTWSVAVNPVQGVTRCYNSPEEQTFFIGNRLYSPNYVEQLMRHEMLHVFRAVLGLRQPGVLLKELLGCGLAGYEGTEEGLAIVSEAGAGSGKEPRKQTMLARVVTADSALQTMSFRQAYERLRDLNLTASNAYNVVLGTYRGGGCLKDALYLQGSLQIQQALAAGEDLSSLFVGKTAIHHMDEAQVLVRSGVLQPASVIPNDFRFLFAANSI